MWLPILICLGAVCLIAGPILLMQPTPAERREALLRQQALKEGLRVHLQPPPAGSNLPGEPRFAAMYCLPCKDNEEARNKWTLVKKGYRHDLHVAGFWDWQQETRQIDLVRLRSSLESVPDGVFAVASGPQGLCCYWSERGGVEGVRAVADWLKETSLALKSV